MSVVHDQSLISRDCFGTNLLQSWVRRSLLMIPTTYYDYSDAVLVVLEQYSKSRYYYLVLVNIPEQGGYVKTRIKVFPLELAVKARMIEHAFLGRLRDEYWELAID